MVDVETRFKIIDALDRNLLIDIGKNKAMCRKVNELISAGRTPEYIKDYFDHDEVSRHGAT